MGPWLCLALVVSCARGTPPGTPRPSYGAAGTQAAFDLNVRPSQPGFFYELPYPSDLRLTPDGKPQLAAFPNPRGLPLIDTFAQLAMQRGGFPVMPVGYFRFSAPLSAEASGLLLDLDEPALVPTVWSQPPRDD